MSSSSGSTHNDSGPITSQRDSFSDEPEEPQRPPPIDSLPFLLKSLFSLNGLTLSLETLGLMYVVNTRVEIPLAFLPAYYSLSFLPYSLKPVYGYLCQHFTRRSLLFLGLLVANSLTVFSTCLIPNGGVLKLFILSFLRGVTDSWAELCLGITLIDHARNHPEQSTFDSLASHFQAQAATARNMGSLVGSMITCILFLERYLVSPDQTQLSGGVANGLLVLSGTLQVLGAVFTFMNRDDFEPKPNHDFILMNAEEPVVDEESKLRDDGDSHPSYSSHGEDRDNESISSSSSLRTPEPFLETNNSYANILLVALLQMTVVILSLKQQIVDFASHLLFRVLLFSLVMGMVFAAAAIYANRWWKNTHRVGLYLILKHAIPTDSMILGAFYYFLFQSKPLLLQILSLTEMGTTTFSSWTYSKIWSKYSSRRELLLLIAGTTVLAAIASLGNIVAYEHSSSAHIFWIALFVKLIHKFFEEWSFLPDVVLATTSVSVGREEGVTNIGQVLSQSPEDETDPAKNIAVEYGTVISCLDFGDQLGALLAGPFVAMLGISRENDFANMDRLVLLCSLLSFLSIGLVLLLRKQ